MQLEMLCPWTTPDHLTVAEGLAFLWKYHFRNKPSKKAFSGNRKALCKTLGHIQMGSLTRLTIKIRHCEIREKKVGPQTLRHDLMLLTLLYNVTREWKEEGYELDGFQFNRLILPDRNPTDRIKKPKGQPRRRVVTLNEWANFREHASDCLARRAFFAIDTGLQECDLRILKVDHYDPSCDAIVIGRRKNKERAVMQTIAVTSRCRNIILERKRLGFSFVLDWTNHINQWRFIRLKLKITWQWRDLRKSYGNLIRKLSGYNTKAMQKALGHKSIRTTDEWYVIDDGGDLRPFIKTVPKVYA